MKKKLFFALFVTLSFTACKSVDFDQLGTDSEKAHLGDAKNLSQEEYESEEFYKQLEIEEELKVVDIPKTVVYVEKPVYYPVEEEQPKLTGKEAVTKSTNSSIMTPEQFRYGTMFYDFNDDFTYEVYCQPYRTTDLVLEPGEQVIEMPFLSENTVWEIGAGVSRTNGKDTQHFFIKPTYTNLITSFIIITDKRIYHILLKSFKDCYMTQVKWNYPNTMPFTLTGSSGNSSVNSMDKSFTGIDPRYLSFDYKMRYSIFKKPYWLPYRVYDDGEKTYITMNETVLHMTTPVLFNKYDERINYSVKDNLIIIHELIEKVTLRIGKQKVIITKKNYKPEKEPNIEEEIKKEETVFRGIHQPIMKEGPLSPDEIPVQTIDVSKD